MTRSRAIMEKTEAIKGWVIELHRQLHRHPELSCQEFKTSALVCKAFGELDIPYQSGVADDA